LLFIERQLRDTVRVLDEATVASWLVPSNLERVLGVRALAWDIVLCSWSRHFLLYSYSSRPLSIKVYNWVLAGSNPAMVVKVLLVRSCYRNRVKLLPGEPLGSHADFASLPFDGRCRVNPHCSIRTGQLS